MADSYWRNVDRETRRRYEERYQDGNAPIDGMGPPEESEKTVPPNPQPGEPMIKIEMETYSNVTCNPPPELVFEECNKCGGHNHEVKILFGAVVGTPSGGIQGPGIQDQQHADDDHFGEHLGELYVNSLCRGQEIMRSVLTWTQTGRVATSWKFKTIDHVKNGFAWMGDISNNPCKDAEKIGEYFKMDLFEDEPERPQKT